MSTSSSDADESSSRPAPGDREEINPWVVRFFLVLAFGVAFGIEGMTLIRSYLLEERDADEQVESEERAGGDDEQPADAPLRIGDDLLPATAVSERVTEMKIRAQSDGPWVFRLVVTVINEGGGAYRLAVRDLETDDGSVLEDEAAVDCPPGDSTQLVATWPVGSNARPRALTAEGEVREANDSTRTVRRRVSFGHVPVQMER